MRSVRWECCARRRRREQACRLERRTAPREGAAPRADERLVRWIYEHARVPGEGLWPRLRDDAARDAAHPPRSDMLAAEAPRASRAVLAIRAHGKSAVN